MTADSGSAAMEGKLEFATFGLMWRHEASVKDIPTKDSAGSLDMALC